MTLEKPSGSSRTIAAALCVALTVSAAFALDVSNVSARQRWPWNNLVDIDFTLSDVESSETFYRIDLKASYSGMAGDAAAAKSLLSEPLVKGNGVHTLVWDMGADFPGLVASNLTVTVSAAPLAPTDPVYLVVDLSGGSSATSYPVRYTLTGPDLTDDACRTTELWLKLCPAGTFTMGTDSSSVVDTKRLPAHTVTLTKPFYLGVFEVTQEQWFHVKGDWPSYYTNETYRATRPVEKVTYDQQIRVFTGWYDNGATPGSTRFFGRLRTRTGLNFDLPTEAQWEYACRAGTTGLYYDSRFTYTTIQDYCRFINGSTTIGASVTFNRNDDTTKGTAKVGSYDPNPWGFYDMYGNVAEICGDGNPYQSGCNDSCKNKFTTYIEGGGTFVDPRSPIPTSQPGQSNGYPLRGGAFERNWPSSYGTSVSREFGYDGGADRSYGFRACLTAE